MPRKAISPEWAKILELRHVPLPGHSFNQDGFPQELVEDWISRALSIRDPATVKAYRNRLEKLGLLEAGRYSRVKIHANRFAELDDFFLEWGANFDDAGRLTTEVIDRIATEYATRWDNPEPRGKLAIVDEGWIMLLKVKNQPPWNRAILALQTLAAIVTDQETERMLTRFERREKGIGPVIEVRIDKPVLLNFLNELGAPKGTTEGRTLMKIAEAAGMLTLTHHHVILHAQGSYWALPRLHALMAITGGTQPTPKSSMEEKREAAVEALHLVTIPTQLHSPFYGLSPTLHKVQRRISLTLLNEVHGCFTEMLEASPTAVVERTFDPTGEG